METAGFPFAFQMSRDFCRPPHPSLHLNAASNRPRSLRFPFDLRYTLAQNHIMPAITAVLHTHDDALRLGRALETLYPCDEILIVDHGSQDSTVQVAREYGARIIVTKAGSVNKTYLRSVVSGWILCLDPRESLTEALAASLFEWKSETIPAAVSSFSMFQREETADGWVQNPQPQTRLVPVHWNRWDGCWPVSESSALSLEGELLRFAFP